jgi:hypothetical protein
MQTYLSRLFLVLAFMIAATLTALADDRARGQPLREETWALIHYPCSPTWYGQWLADRFP